MLRSLTTTILILAGALVLCLLVVRLVVSALYTLSGVRRRGACEQILGW